MPPVTADRSPPASRITGALSPVMALSFTLAMPWMISPSPGIRSLVSTSTSMPLRRAEAGVGLGVRSVRLFITFAVVSLRERRRLSARARPRPSATASAKVANSTVSQSHSAMAAGKVQLTPITALRDAEDGDQCMATISVTKMTGLAINPAGLSFSTASRAARASRTWLEQRDGFGGLRHD